MSVHSSVAKKTETIICLGCHLIEDLLVIAVLKMPQGHEDCQV